MTPTTLAILGLFFWLWSHELGHNYHANPNRLRLAFYAGTGIAASVLLITALFSALR
jgi:hypothetical protein